MSMPVEVFNSPSALPKDPILRKQHLEDLMTKIHGSFSFMQVRFKNEHLLSLLHDGTLSYMAVKSSQSFLFQDSLLDGEISPTSSHSKLRRLQSGSPPPLGNFCEIKLCHSWRYSCSELEAGSTNLHFGWIYLMCFYGLGQLANASALKCRIRTCIRHLIDTELSYAR